jgi:DNA-binding response OmpR family regulator
LASKTVSFFHEKKKWVLKPPSPVQGTSQGLTPSGLEVIKMFSILVVDDDKNTRLLFRTVLETEGYLVYTADNGKSALAVMDREHIDLVVLDVMMPEMDGYDFTKTLRENQSTLPILMVSAKQLPEDKKQGFLVGTDDYMTKPIDEEEMLLRIKALLRRAQIVSERRITLGDVTLDYDALTVSRGEEVQVLPQKEFLLLYKLLSYPGKIFTRIQLMDEIWGADSDTGWETVTVHIGRLRKRFEGWDEFEIVSVRGLGYKAVKKV